MSTLQVNYTPMPAGYDAANDLYTVLIHVSFGKTDMINGKETPIKIHFEDFAAINKYVKDNIGKILSLNILNGAATKTLKNNILIPAPIDNYWTLFDYKVPGQLKAFFVDKVTLDHAMDKARQRQQENTAAIKAMRDNMEKEERITKIATLNIKVYDDLIQDLTTAIAALKPETDKIAASDAAIKYMAEHEKRKSEYEIKKAELVSADAARTALQKANNEALAQLLEEAATLVTTNTMLDDFKNHKFISGSQDKAVKYITEKLLGKETEKSASPDNGDYTSEIDWQEKLSLSDVLGYFSSYPAVQTSLGLLYKVQLPKDQLAPGNVLQVDSSNLVKGNMAVNFFKVRFELDEKYFYPKPLDANKYKKGYLDLTRKNPGDNTPLYALLQNSFEEVKHRSNTAGPGDGKTSDYTSGFFLVQSEAKSDLDTTDHQPDIFHLEHLLQGYRVDFRRAGFTWESLHRRDYHFNFSTYKEVGEPDEGLIAAGSAAKAFQLATAVRKYPDNPEKAPDPSGDINILQLPIGLYVYSLDVPGGIVSIDLHLDVTDGAAAVSSMVFDIADKLTTVSFSISKSAKPIPLDAIPAFIKKLNDDLVDKKALLMQRSIQFDNVGRLYYKGIPNEKGDYDAGSELPSYLPSSLICHINGYSLSTPKYMGEKLTKFFQMTNLDGNSIGIETFLMDRNIRHTIHTKTESLPLIRIGDLSKVRCRLVCIGGISIPPEDKNEDYCLEKTLKRQDPIPAPKLLMPLIYKDKIGTPPDYSAFRKLGDTESRIVIRQGDSTTYPLTATRLIAPPSITPQLAEWLKMMDDKNNLPDGELMNRVKTTKLPVYTKTPETYNGRPVYLHEPGTGNFEDFAEASARTPYIPDCMAHYFMIAPIRLHSQKLVDKIDFSRTNNIGDTVWTANKVELDTLSLAFYNEFIQKKPRFWGTTPAADRKADAFLKLWTLKVIADDEKIWVKVDVDTWVITIALTEGDDVEFAIRSFTDDETHLANLYYLKKDDWNDVRQGKHPDSLSVVLAENRFRTVYALKKPSDPHAGKKPVAGSDETQQFNVNRYISCPEDVIMEQSILFRGRTCGETNLVAAWEEIIDDASDYKEDNKSPLRIVYHHKKVFSYFEPGFYSDGVKANGEFSFPKEKVVSPLLIEEGIDPAEKEAYAAGKGLAQRRLFADLDGHSLRFKHELGSSKYHAIRYMMTGISRFGDYYPKTPPPTLDSFDTAWFQNGIQGVEFGLEATRPPAIPQVDSMIPLFETTRTNAFETKKVFKGIRVYLKRPWFSSGYREKLAVITEVADNTIPEEKYGSFVSLYGRDATSTGNRPTAPLYLNKINVEDNTYLLPGTGDPLLNVKIAVFPVYFDKTKGCWFADIDMDHPVDDSSYCPFVRLVLARFQKLAKATCELSLPLACDFMQIFPDRTISIAGREINITAPAVKKAGDKLLSEVRYWSFKNDNQLRRDGSGIFIDDLSKLKPSDPVAYNQASGKFSFTPPPDDKSLLIREYELFTNTREGDPTDFQTRRLLYSHTITLR